MNSQLNVRRKDTYLTKSTFENKYANMKHDKLQQTVYQRLRKNFM